MSSHHKKSFQFQLRAEVTKQRKTQHSKEQLEIKRVERLAKDVILAGKVYNSKKNQKHLEKQAKNQDLQQGENNALNQLEDSIPREYDSKVRLKQTTASAADLSKSVALAAEKTNRETPDPLVNQTKIITEMELDGKKKLNCITRKISKLTTTVKHSDKTFSQTSSDSTHTDAKPKERMINCLINEKRGKETITEGKNIFPKFTTQKMKSIMKKRNDESDLSTDSYYADDDDDDDKTSATMTAADDFSVEELLIDQPETITEDNKDSEIKKLEEKSGEFTAGELALKLLDVRGPGFDTTGGKNLYYRLFSNKFQTCSPIYHSFQNVNNWEKESILLTNPPSLLRIEIYDQSNLRRGGLDLDVEKLRGELLVNRNELGTYNFQKWMFFTEPECGEMLISGNFMPARSEIAKEFKHANLTWENLTGNVELSIIECRNLRGLEEGVQPDPFVVASVSDKYCNFQTSFRTTVHSNTSNPQWTERFSINNPSSNIRFHIKNFDKSQNTITSLGFADCSISALVLDIRKKTTGDIKEFSFDVWTPIRDGEGDLHLVGNIKLDMQVERIKSDVIVKVLEAEGLQFMDSSEKINPCVIISMADRESNLIMYDLLRTTTVNQTRNPKWNGDIEIIKIQQPNRILHFRIMNGSKLIGIATLDLNDIDVRGMNREMWLPVEKGTGKLKIDVYLY